jgi:DNA modification methylase
MMFNKIYQGDASDVLKTLPGNCVNTCVTSPPYYGLRDYGVPGQIGLEETPGQYISRLVEVFIEVRRVLRDDGTLWLNIADSYAGSRKGGATHPDNAGKYKQGTNRGLIGAAAVTGVTWGNCKHKDLIGIPWMLAFALRDAGYYLRQEIIWAKPNPMPESVQDRCTRSHEYIFLLSKSRRYYFDAKAIQEPCVQSDDKIRDRDNTRLNNTPGRTRMTGLIRNNYEYRNKRDVWTVSTKPYRGAHFATFPVDLIEPCILAGCPAGGIVLDPFFGSGTVGVAAEKHGRQYIGIEINPGYIELADRRINESFLQGTAK